MTTWGHLERIGGTEDATNVPPKVTLQDSECFVGRFAEPVKAPDSKFTHKTQTLVPCLFVSSTHFSIGKVDGKMNTYFIKDYSRNGTYLNNELVGPSRTVEFKDGAEISLMYKNKVRILYRFKEAVAPVKAPSPEPASAVKDDREDLEESSRFASMRSQADSVEFALNKQIGLLQEESRQHETRIAQQAARIEGLSNDLNRSSEKNATLEKQVASLESEKADLSERLSTNESHSAAVAATTAGCGGAGCGDGCEGRLVASGTQPRNGPPGPCNKLVQTRHTDQILFANCKLELANLQPSLSLHEVLAHPLLIL